MVDKKKHENDIVDETVTPDDEAATDTSDVDEIEMEANAATKIKDLQAKLKAAETERREAQEELQRNKADYLNARKRLEDDRIADRKRDTRAFIESLLPLCDSFSVAMQDEAVWQKVDEQWRKGVEGIHSQLRSILKAYNVEQDSPHGISFDPTKHEAVGETPTTEQDMDGKIMSVVQSGYYVAADPIEWIRPARVIVGKYSEAAKADDEADNA